MGSTTQCSYRYIRHQTGLHTPKSGLRRSKARRMQQPSSRVIRDHVGTLDWAALATRPDIALAVVLCKPRDGALEHREADFSGTRDLWLTYGDRIRQYAISEYCREITGYDRWPRRVVGLEEAEKKQGL